MYSSFANGCLDKRAYGMEIVWSRLAKETLATIVEYVETNFNSTVAVKVYNKINGHVESLAFFPRIGMKDSYFSSSKIEVRYIINTPNIIHYGIKGNTIIVISVFDTRRSPDTISAVVKDFLEHYKE